MYINNVGVENMSKNQNIYDNDAFFEGYKKLRENSKNPIILEERPAIFNLCPKLTDKSILDLGCGYGDNCVSFSQMGAAKVVGIDISKKMLSIANAENKRDNINYINLDMDNIFEIKEKYDVIFSSLAVHYIKDFRQLLHNINDLLNTNGTFIFSQEHPLSTAPISGVHWTRDEKWNILHYDLTDYRRDGERIVSWIVDGVTKYHRCFSEIANSIIDEGFSIERMLEPIPATEMMEKLPYYEKGMHKPNYLIIRAKKI
jgi:2-polyprenyl-3-methyl-5-hydroxy-6-metoxy-1,4-benzoquinol methylase